MERMKNELLSRFERLEISIKLLSVFTAAAGVLTALMALLAPDKSSLYSISASPALWIAFVLVIALKTKKPVDCAFMTGVMLLGSQFAAALIKTPFDREALTVFFKWVLISALCVTYAYFLKRAFIENGRLKDALLSATSAFYVICALSSLKVLVYSFPWRLLSFLFCIAMALVLFYFAMHDRSSMIIAVCVCGGVFFISSIVLFSHRYRYSCVVMLDEARYPLTTEWSVEVSDSKISKADIEGSGNGAVLNMTIYEEDDNTITLTDENGNEYSLTVSYNEKKGVNIR